MSYDQHIDMIYVFIAKINQASGYKELKFETKTKLAETTVVITNTCREPGGDEKGIHFDVDSNRLVIGAGLDNSNSEDKTPDERAL